MYAMGPGITYLVQGEKAYLVGKLDHDSFINAPNSHGAPVFSFTIDTHDRYRDFATIQPLEEFHDFHWPINHVFDSAGNRYSAINTTELDILEGKENLEGRIIVHKVLYHNEFIPIGYIYFEFNIEEANVLSDVIRVQRGAHIEDYVKIGFQEEQVQA